VVRNPLSGAPFAGVKDANAGFRGTSRSGKCRDREKAKLGAFADHPFGSGYAGLRMKVVAPVCFAATARGKTRFGLRPTRLSPRYPKSGQLMCYETGQI
jgi:hypothetical protein